MDPILLGKGITDDVAVTLLPKLGNRGLAGRRHRHRQDRDPDDPGRRLFATGRTRIPRRREGRRVRPGRAGHRRGEPAQRAAEIGVADYAPAASPTIFWDLYGKLGHPVRTTVSEMGRPAGAHRVERHPVRRARHSVQAGRRSWPAAAGHGRSAPCLAWWPRAQGHFHRYGLVSAQSIAAIQRSVLRLAQDGGENFFGEPALDLADIMRVNHDGRGMIGILAADQLVLKPKLYSTFLLWLFELPNRWAPGRRSWSSSSTRPTCCSTTHRRRWCSASSRWCA